MSLAEAEPTLDPIGSGELASSFSPFGEELMGNWVDMQGQVASVHLAGLQKATR